MSPRLAQHHYVAVAVDDLNRNNEPKSPSPFRLTTKRKKAFFLVCVGVVLLWILLENELLLQYSSLSQPSSSSETFSYAAEIVPATDSDLFPATATVMVEPLTTTSSAVDIAAPPPSPPATERTPKMFDIILFNNEFDLLDLRLHELRDVVDTFVIIESKLTFSGRAKKLHYKAAAKQFTKFQDKILHIELPPMTKAEAKSMNYLDIWGNEAYTRNKGVQLAIQKLQLQEGDWLLHSDLDEIPRPTILHAMKFPEPGAEVSSYFLDRPHTEGAWDLFRFGCRFYYYSFEFYHGNWIGPVVMRYRETESHLTRVAIDGQESEELLNQKEFLSRVRENDWADLGRNLRGARTEQAATYVDDACWHCSWCFKRISEVVEKTKSYSHTDHNQPRFQEQDWILRHFRQGIDMFERPSEVYTHIVENFDIPNHVRFNRKKYLHMVERYHQPDAGFIDVVRPTALKSPTQPAVNLTTTPA
ncbi:hypothetical protein BG004_008371 [Podila humilis]|nr:hypothetical protein BG004_008371 [Podila humilis]